MKFSSENFILGQHLTIHRESKAYKRPDLYWPFVFFSYSHAWIKWIPSKGKFVNMHRIFFDFELSFIANSNSETKTVASLWKFSFKMKLHYSSLCVNRRWFVPTTALLVQTLTVIFQKRSYIPDTKTKIIIFNSYKTRSSVKPLDESIVKERSNFPHANNLRRPQRERHHATYSGYYNVWVQSMCVSV